MRRALGSRAARTIGSAAIAVVLLAWLLRIEDPRELIATLQQASLGLVALAVLPAIGFGLARAWRFRILLEPAGAPRRRGLLAVTLAGWSVGLLLPGPVGDGAFVWLASRQLEVPILRATGAVLLARVFDVVSLLTIAVSTAMVVGVRLPVFVVAAGTGLALLGGGALGAIFWRRSRHYLVGLLARVQVARRLAARAGDALDALGQIHNPGGLVVSTVAARCSTVVLYLCLFAAIGHPLTVWQVWFAVSIRTLLLAVPVQGLAGLGTTQLWWTGALTMLGLPVEDAVGVALAVHLLDLAVSLPVGLAGWAALLRHPSRRGLTEAGRRAVSTAS
ncbi:MAG TPA: lysylphosphatidylglycerol synthase transmembrane domain-containing protein [Candidatus Limnocylindrales bacterium]|nr:lysylphosphatidylglycerol synthase transmembrane domain-containing protein [Candidatus Limnocylindrales bacterium]